MMPRKFCDEDIDKATELRRRGEKWIVIEALLGEGIQGACDRRRRLMTADDDTKREVFAAKIWREQKIATPWIASASHFADMDVQLQWQAFQNQ
ncbi:hypothetical protein EY04_17430 [Pseudomonas chlororaphis]|uniref:hypothetical protein n=1 Tax=Pseudomonas chlororaphis TaxID=587753 RepID=UPI0004AC0A01|nr:hypothetical protein [Pseudomonas chlororaphis]AIC20620.1 hypothetical protein EY04_17430 [Pseudomonas chlororaphis]